MHNQKHELATVGTGGGLSFTGCLALIFIVLKLTGVINWSWVWVLSPIWISLIITLVILGITAIVIWIKWGREFR